MNMGDRYYRYFPCPECGKEVEEYDAPSCVQHSSHCDACGWDDGLNYYEEVLPNGNIYVWLLKKEEAVKRGIIVKCPKCNKKCMNKSDSMCYTCQCNKKLLT